MNLAEIENKQKWNTFVKQVSPNRFSQSWEWGEFQESRGFKVKRLALLKENDFMAGASFVEHKLMFGLKYWYAPGGPVFNQESGKKEKKEFFNLIKAETGKAGKIIFLRLEPEKEFPEIGFRLEETCENQPSRSLVLNLTRPGEKILAEMHQKTRYNIRLALRKGVAVREASSGEFQKWWEIMRQTGKRDGFRIHPCEHYEKMLKFPQQETSQKDLKIKLYLAEYEGKVIAGNIVAFFGDTVTYLHGASTYEDRKLMAPYALQWRLLEKARSRGYGYYDFYGINEEKWPGVTRFKKGFGGEEVNYPGTFDLIFDKKWYNIYKILRKIRRML